MALCRSAPSPYDQIERVQLLAGCPEQAGQVTEPLAVADPERPGRASGRPRIAVAVATGATRRSRSSTDASLVEERPPPGAPGDATLHALPPDVPLVGPPRPRVRQGRSWERGRGGRPGRHLWHRRTTTPDPVTATSPVFWRFRCEIGRLADPVRRRERSGHCRRFELHQEFREGETRYPEQGGGRRHAGGGEAACQHPVVLEEGVDVGRVDVQPHDVGE
jgi:hypothetical protein